MKKQGVVLLISLMFIVAISALIVKNVDSSDKILKNANLNTTLVQLQLGVNNINTQVMNLFSEHQSKIDDDIFWENVPETLPLEYGKLKAFISIQPYEQENLILFDKNVTQGIKNYYPEMYVDEYNLKRFISEHNITNKKQINFVLDKYVDYVKDDKILELKDSFVAKKYDDKNNTVNFIQLDYIIEINNFSANVNTIINVQDKKQELFKMSLQRLE